MLLKRKLILFFVFVFLFAGINALSHENAITIDMRGGDNGFVYYYGQEIDISIQLDQPSYLIVYAISLDGDIRILFPNADNRDNYVHTSTVSVTRYSKVLADVEGPVFLAAISSNDRRFWFSYQDRSIPLWSPLWGEYHPTYSFISDEGFGRDNNFPIVLGSREVRFHSRRIIDDSDYDRLVDELNDKIYNDFSSFDTIIDYFVADLNEAVNDLDMSFDSSTAEFYIAGSKYNREIYYRASSYRADDRPSRRGSIRFNVHLDPYGHWIDMGGVWVWRPYTYHTWRPFVHGYWRWSPYGWIWVCYTPWRITFNYGYWYYHYRYGYVWIPGYQWHPARVIFYYHGGYVGWRPAPVPRVYRSRVRPRTRPHAGEIQHDQYVFVSYRDFMSKNISDRVIPENIFNSEIKQYIDTDKILDFHEGDEFFREITKKHNISIETVELERSSILTDNNERFEVLIPGIDEKDKNAFRARQDQFIREAEAQKRREQAEMRDRSDADADRTVTREQISREDIINMRERRSVPSKDSSFRDLTIDRNRSINRISNIDRSVSRPEDSRDKDRTEQSRQVTRPSAPRTESTARTAQPRTSAPVTRSRTAPPREQTDSRETITNRSSTATRQSEPEKSQTSRSRARSEEQTKEQEKDSK